MSKIDCPPLTGWLRRTILSYRVDLIFFENERSVFHRCFRPAITFSPRFVALHCGLIALSGLVNKVFYLKP